MATFKIYTLGCKVNQYDSSDLRGKLISVGFAMADKNTNIAIINTCCVTKTAIHKCKRMINKARKENPKAKIVVMGCWPVAYKDEVEKLDVDLIWGVGELNELVQQILNFKLQITNKSQIINLKLQKNRSRYFIKVQDGCEQFCSYCIIPWTRGKLRSRSMQEIIEEVKQAIEIGYREVVLCGIHLGLYGYAGIRHCLVHRMKGQGNTLFALLEQLVKIKDLGRVRLSSIEVTEVNNELIKLMAANKKICKHLHIPAQSGCDKILKSMNRPYDTKYFKNKVRNIRQSMPDCAITADVIVGFPGETEKDFKETYNFVKKIQFSRLHVFPFSAHKKTPAAKMDQKISGHEIKIRADRLKKLGTKLESDYRKKFVGKDLEVVAESVSENKIKGKTEYYFDVEFNKSQIIANSERMSMDSNIDFIGELVKVKMAI